MFLSIVFDSGFKHECARSVVRSTWGITALQNRNRPQFITVFANQRVCTYGFIEVRSTGQIHDKDVLSRISRFRNSDLSFLAARYLGHALKLQLRGNNLYRLASIWHCYMDVIQEEARRVGAFLTIEWTNVNHCFQTIALAGRSAIVFLPTTRLFNFASILIR